MRRAIAATVLVSLFGCDEVMFREDAQAALEDAAVDPGTTPAEAGFEQHDASPDAAAASEDDADIPAIGDAAQQTDASLPAPDAGSDADAEPPTPSDAGRATTYADLQPLFRAKCTPCHAADAGHYAPFADTYDALRAASKLCPGDVVAGCIPRAVAIERMEGSGCRTYDQPFHREAWPCLSADERSAILGWQEPGVRGP